MNPNTYKRTLYVGNIDETATEELIRAAFIPFGEIVSIDIPVDSFTKKARNFAFVEFEEVEDAKAAMENMSNSELLGKVISCTIAKPQSVIQAQERAAASEDGVVTETVVKTNTREKRNVADLPPAPPGFKRCLECGGWGKSLVNESGYCNHCTRLLAQS